MKHLPRSSPQLEHDETKSVSDQYLHLTQYTMKHIVLDQHLYLTH